jgi:uncharacterized protein YndB with AHSA1/START domain
MAEAPTPDETTEVGITITRVFDATPERVWREWTEPERFADWFGGTQSEVPLSSVSMDVRPDGWWRLTMFAPRGEIHWEGQYREVVEPERLVFTLTDRPGEETREVVIVVLTDVGDGRTEMRLEQRGGTLPPEGYKRAAEGWSGFLDRIEERLAEN